MTASAPRRAARLATAVGLIGLASLAGGCAAPAGPATSRVTPPPVDSGASGPQAQPWQPWQLSQPPQSPQSQPPQSPRSSSPASAAATAPGMPATLAEPLTGRLAIRVAAHDGQPARAETIAFELRGDPLRGSLALATPLGTQLARARWSPGEDVVLATSQGERRYPDLDAMAEAALGEPIPVAALFDWLRGRPWAGAPATLAVAPRTTPSTAAPASIDASTGPGTDPAPADAPRRFSQLGWQVDAGARDGGSIEARRDAPPAVTVRARLDRVP